MSLTATRWAWQQSIAAGPKYVLLALADYADNEGACFPSQKKLAEKCTLSRATINVHLQFLVSNELIIIKHRSNAQGRRRASFYYLALSQSPDFKTPKSGFLTRQNPESRQHISSHLLTYHKNLISPDSGLWVSCSDKPALKDAL